MRAHLLRLPFLGAATLLLLACQNGGSPTEPSASVAAKATAASTSAPVTGVEDGATAEPRGRAIGGRVGARQLAAREDATASAGGETAVSRVVEQGNGHGNGGNGNGGNGNGGNGNGGNGNGGNGNGGNGNGGNGGGGAVRPLRLEIQPDTWNTNFAGSQGTISALVRGTDVARIEAGSVLLLGDGGGTAQPARIQTAGGQLRAFFSQSEALATLDDPDPGEVHEVTLQLTVGGTPTELTARVRIVGPGGPGNPGDPVDGQIDLAIQPDTWNTNWARSHGSVSVLLRGDVADVDLGSLVLVGDSGTEVPPTSVKRTGHQVRARFAMRGALASLDDPDPGETHEVKVRFSDGGTAKELAVAVRVVGPRKSSGM